MSADFHFLRPEWLWVIVLAGLLMVLHALRFNAHHRWRTMIAAPLLEHLIIARHGRLRLRPMHSVVAMLSLGALAAAGPTWQRERPPFVEDKAPLVIAIDLSVTMDAIDVAPTRLERAKLKIHDLLALRRGARTAVVAYAGSAHLVLPLTDDAGLIDTYVDSLATRLMPVPGRNTGAALKAVEQALQHESTPGTVLFLTDGVEPEADQAFLHRDVRNEMLVLGIGTPAGGPVRAGPDSFREDASGERLFARLDVERLEKFGRASGVGVATMTVDDSDVRWVERRAEVHLEQQRAAEESRWKDQGWWLLLALVPIAALSFRRGWTVRWAAVLLVAATLGAPRFASAADLGLSRLGLSDFTWRDLWLTRDQQGRLAYERGDFAAAAALFEDPMWKGTALYRARHFAEAFQAFAHVDSAESYYDQGNSLAQLGKFPAAAASYREALKRRPDWPDAAANLKLVESLIPPKPHDKDRPDENANPEPGESEQEKKFKGGQRAPAYGSESADIWMRNIETTPAELLRRKFALQAQGAPP